MGSPDFAVPSLLGLVNAGYDVSLVLSQPDRQAGRGRGLARPPVAQQAERLGLPIHQPASLRSDEARQPIRDAQPHLIVVAAFGLILPPAVLELPERGCLNVHASLLPRHRGAAPIQAAILAGDTKTGITLMRMDSGLDTGDIIRSRSLPIDNTTDAPSLENALSAIGRDILMDTLPDWLAGTIQPTPQDDSLATYAPKITRDDARLSWTQSAEVCARAVRAYRGWPNAYTAWNGRIIQVLEADVSDADGPSAEPGTVVLDPSTPRSLAVTAGSGLLRLRRVRLEGRNPITGGELLNGYPGIIGATLES